MKEFEYEVFFSTEIDDSGELVNPSFGKLIYKNHSSIKLESFAYSEKCKISPDHELFHIFCYTIDKKRITAINCFIQKQPSPFNISSEKTIFTTKYIINGLLTGAWIKDTDDIKVKQTRLRTSYLEHWFRKFQIDINEQHTQLKIPLEQFHNDFDVEINNLFHIRLGSSCKYAIEYNKEFSLSSKKYLELNYNTNIDFISAKKHAAILCNLFQVLVFKKNIYTEELSFTTNYGLIEYIFSSSSYEPESKDVFYGNYLIMFDINHSKYTFSKWFELQERFGYIFDTLISILSNNTFKNTETKFLAYIQWLEGFCRIKYPKTDEEVSTHKSKIDSIRQQLNEDEFLEYFNTITNYPYENGLRTQLKKLFKDIKLKEILKIDSKHLKTIINHVYASRNMLTHPDEKHHEIIPLTRLSIILQHIILITVSNELSLNNRSDAYDEIVRHIHFSLAEILKSKNTQN